MRYIFRYLAIFVLVSGFLFVLWLLWFFNNHFIFLTPEGKSPNMVLTGAIGDFVGGVVGTAFSFAATLLLVVTLLEQNNQNKRNIFVQSYYEMLHVHAEHVRQIILNKQDKTFKGREVFPQLIKSYNSIYNNVSSYVSNIINGGLQGLKEERAILDYLSDSNKRERLTMRLTYGYFFYGTDSFRLLHYNDNIEKTIEDCIISISKKGQFYTKGYHVLLGHYFRHMFQMIQYIIKADFLNEQERYTYSKQLRAQLDDDEQLLLYYDSMADVGNEWIIPSFGDNEVNRVEEMCPIARFRMIKNIPSSTAIKGLDPSIQFSKEIEFYKRHSINFFEQR